MQLTTLNCAMLHLQLRDNLCLFESIGYDGCGPRDAMSILSMSILIPSVVLVLLQRILGYHFSAPHLFFSKYDGF